MTPKFYTFEIIEIMVYVRFPNVKTGISPSPRTMVDLNNLTATQRVMLTRNRIWGNMLGNSESNGYQTLKKKLQGESRMQWYKMHDLKMIYPWIDNWEDRNKKKLKYEERKSRIFMRGIKIGVKRTVSNKSMTSFEQGGKAKTPEELQAEAEAAAKAKMTDDLLTQL